MLITTYKFIGNNFSYSFKDRISFWKRDKKDTIVICMQASGCREVLTYFYEYYKRECLSRPEAKTILTSSAKDISFDKTRICFLSHNAKGILNPKTCLRRINAFENKAGITRSSVEFHSSGNLQGFFFEGDPVWGSTNLALSLYTLLIAPRTRGVYGRIPQEKVVKPYLNLLAKNFNKVLIEAAKKDEDAARKRKSLTICIGKAGILSLVRGNVEDRKNVFFHTHAKRALEKLCLKQNQETSEKI